MAHRRALAAAALAAATALVVSAAPASAAAPPYVALGDSYSSGTGTRTYIADGTSCLRSVYAYPSLIASAKGYALNFRACSGAKIADVTNTQLSALTAGTAYVTISDRRQRRGLRRRPHHLRAAGVAEQLHRGDRQGAGLHPQHPARRASPRSTRDPGPRPAGQGHRRRLPAHLQRRRTATSSRGSRRPRCRGSTPRPTSSTRRRPGGRARPASRSPTRRRRSSGTRCATARSGSTACPTRSSRATTRTGRDTRAATRRP